MRAAFAAALDPRFEERFLARAAADNAAEAKAALDAKLVRSISIYAYTHTHTPRARTHTQMLRLK